MSTGTSEGQERDSGIFTLFALGLTTLGGVFIWTWPVVAPLAV